MSLLRRVASTRVLIVAAVVFLATCGGSGGGSDDNKNTATDECPTHATSSPTRACGDVGITTPVCTTKTPVNTVTDLTGTWVLETIGAQVVQVSSFPQPFHIKSINMALVQVAQTGSAVTFDGQYCNRIQQDDPRNPAKVVVLEAWRLSPTPFHRSGTFTPDETGTWTLNMPSAVETFGARLAAPACDTLPLDVSDPRLADDDGDGSPGISVGLQGLVNGSLRAVQRQVTALSGVAVASDRIEGGMAYDSDQTVVASDPTNIKCLYSTAQSFADPTVCSSSFVMVKLDTSTVDCAWVRENQTALLGL